VIWAPERAAFHESPAFIGEAIALFFPVIFWRKASRQNSGYLGFSSVAHNRIFPQVFHRKCLFYIDFDRKICNLTGLLCGLIDVGIAEVICFASS
jgi:hypothetical protein